MHISQYSHFMKKNSFLFLFICFYVYSYAQKHDYSLLFGYNGGAASPSNPEGCITIMTFGDIAGVNLSDNQTINMNFNDTNVSMSDQNGSLIFYYNGVYIENAQFNKMENGDTLNLWEELGSDMPQGAIAFPYPGDPEKYILLHETEGYIESPLWGFQAIALYYSIIDMTTNNGLGKVVQRKTLIISDTLTYGQLSAVRHANGRDWWVLIGKSHTNQFYTLLIDPSGIHNLGTQSTGPSKKEGFGYSTFSPDGTKYVSSQGIDFGPNWEYLYIYDFDRCSGTISNGQEIHLVGNAGSGIAISPNSRYLYCPVEEQIFQFDIKSNDILSSKKVVALYNGHKDPFPTKFDKCFLAPDNKIYIVTSSGSRTLHLINRPDEEGALCDVRQPGIRLPCYNARSFPNYPNYRLGPIDASNCDSLNLDNKTVAWWQFEIDSLNPLSIEFRDLSYYEPTFWSWNFGDGSPVDNERHPKHFFQSSGSYQVCLTVSNGISSDSYCQDLSIGSSTTYNIENDNMSIYPNPFNDKIVIETSFPLYNTEFFVYDYFGKRILKREVLTERVELETYNLLSGVYYWTLLTNGQQIGRGKIIKID